MCSTATATLKVKYIRENTDWKTTTDVSKFPLDIGNPKFTGDAASATNTRQAQLTRSHMYSPPNSTSLQVLLREYSAHERCLWFLPIARVHRLHTASMSNALARYWYRKSGTTKEFTNIKADVPNKPFRVHHPVTQAHPDHPGFYWTSITMGNA